ncbi:MAG: AGE family epimerase/isomerase [Anaerolineales bacterium]|nr:AGE family epimerase/isomerase [Anaerolineales bacterium]
MSSSVDRMQQALAQLTEHFEQGLIPFWLSHGLDHVHGGYLTCFDPEGRPTDDTDKYIVTQTRMIWGLSALARVYPERPELAAAARQGVDFFLAHFWDPTYGGWYWKTTRAGAALDTGKVVYGQSFAIYALSEYTLATGDLRGLDYAGRTFDLLQKHAADTFRGGYYENLEPNWQVSAPGFAAGDRKSLDIHMHLLEAFTTLATASGEPVHRRKLQEVIDLILAKMVHPVSGCGLNQFTLDFTPIPAIAIRRTWNAERATGETIATPTDTTSYGHNVELAWLLNRAADVLGTPADRYAALTRRLVDHALQYGLDEVYGGVYRDGPHEGPALVRDKEWWQNCEALVGFLDAYERLGDPRYLEAFFKTWDFAHTNMINPVVGEWRQLLTRTGEVIVGDIGNPWKAIYHSGRAVLESIQRLRRLLAAPTR